MYHQELYDQVLSGAHHGFRRPFDVARASDFTNPSIAPVMRMAMRLEDVCPGGTGHFKKTADRVPSHGNRCAQYLQ